MANFVRFPHSDIFRDGYPQVPEDPRVLRSVKQTNGNAQDEYCPIAFHNCTPFQISIIWIDFEGRPLRYRLLERGYAMKVHTFVNHLWVFKASSDTNDNNNASKPKIVAIPADAMNLQALSRFKTGNDVIDYQKLDFKVLRVCTWCRELIRKNLLTSIKSPCEHFSGEGRISDTDYIDERLPYGPYIYACDTNTHRGAHNQEGRHVFLLVEPLHTLKEMCYLTLMKKLDKSAMEKLQLPNSLHDDLTRFVTLQERLYGYGC